MDHVVYEGSDDQPGFFTILFKEPLPIADSQLEQNVSVSFGRDLARIEFGEKTPVDKMRFSAWMNNPISKEDEGVLTITIPESATHSSKTYTYKIVHDPTIDKWYGFQWKLVPQF